MYNRKRVFTAACLGMLTFGIVLTTLGAILPSVIERFDIDKANAGSLFLLMSAGILAGSLAFGPVVDRYGFKYLLTLSTILVLAGLEGIAFAPTFDLMRLSAFLIGFGGGIINGGANALVADISEESRSASLSILGIFFGLGAFGIPFSLGFLLDRFTYSALVAGIGAVVVAPLVMFIVTRFPVPKQAQGFPLRDGFKLLKNPVLLIFGLFLFFQSGMEITAGGWTAAYFNEELGLGANDAVFFLSLYWVGMVLARLLLGWLLKKTSAAIALNASLGVALAGSLLLLATDDLRLATAGIFLLGAGLAAGFPVVLGYVGDLYPTLSGTAFSIVFVMALTGGSLFPYLTGILGEGVGLRASFSILPAGLVIMAILFAVALRRLFRANIPKEPVHTGSLIL